MEDRRWTTEDGEPSSILPPPPSTLHPLPSPFMTSPAPPLRSVIRPTTFVESARLSNRLGAHLTLASETFQHTGSFKFRAGYNVAAWVPHQRLIAASSGNFGQGLAYACQLLGKSCTIVMPDNSCRVKVDAVRDFGGVVDLIDVRTISRQARVEQLASQSADAYVASAFDDPFVIEGNSTLGEELAAAAQPFDCIVAPVGGGGLTSGLITGLRRRGTQVPVIGVEPSLANDAARSLRAGELVQNESEPQTIADGVRTVSLGQRKLGDPEGRPRVDCRSLRRPDPPGRPLAVHAGKPEIRTHRRPKRGRTPRLPRGFPRSPCLRRDQRRQCGSGGVCGNHFGLMECHPR